MENSRAKPPPGVEEALSSMLWTPYPEESSESSSDESEHDFKRRKRPLTWAVNDNHSFTSGPYSISSRLSYPSYYPPSYVSPTVQLKPTIPRSFTDTFQQEFDQDHRTPITDNGINYQIHQQQSGFISFYNNNNTNSTSVSTPSNNSFHFSSFIGNSNNNGSNDQRTENENDNKENELYCRSTRGMNEPVFVGGGGGGELMLSNALRCQSRQNEFSCVEVVDESGTSAHNDYYYSVIQQQQKKLNKFIVESTLAGCTGMRLNVPGVNMTTTTTIINSNNNNSDTVNNTQNFYVSSASSATTTTTTTVSSDNNSGQGSLTIPVNQQTSSVNIVNCYRTVPVQLVNESNNDENIIIKENIHENKCDIIEVDNDKSNNIINISTTIENAVNQSSDTTSESKCEQSIYISSDAPGINAIISDPTNTNDNSIQTVPTSREQRRRERRERRAARNRLAHIHALHSQAVVNPNQITAQLHLPNHHHTLIANPRPGSFEILPDLLHSHLPPPYTTLPLQPTTAATIIATPVPVPVSAVDNCRYSFPLPIIRRSPSERSGKGCCGQWFAFAGPPLRALIAVVALGGVACALGGAALGATSLAGPPQSHFTAALLMIGVGVILVTISGAAWKMTAPGGPPCLGLGTSADLGRCNRRACARAGNNGHVIYPEFQHRAPPPSYQASMQEYRLRLLLLDRDRQSSVLRVASPPPTYRSTSGSLLRTTPRANQSSGPVSNTSGGGIFSGISEIISGLSHNNNNNVESISNNSSEATLPPSYRTRNNNNRQHTGSHLRPISAYNNNELSHDFTLTVRSSSMENLSRASSHQRDEPPSSSSDPQPNNVNNSKCTSINSSSKKSSCSTSSNQNQIDSESISDSSNKKSVKNGNNNHDLVTIVTISGFIDENEGGKVSASQGNAVLAHL